MIHKTKELTLDSGETIRVDEEMARVIYELNKCGYKTSGCCIGDDDEEAWIIIQETDDNCIAYLMSMLHGCPYNIHKQLYLTDNVLYSQYVINTPMDISPEDKRASVRSWAKALRNGTKGYFDYKRAVMENLFKKGEVDDL